MNWRSRWTFWALVIAVMALISVPSVEWVETLRDYAHFSSGWEPSPLKPTQTTFTPREDRGEPAEPELKPVEFKHKAPKAKSVELVGDFNAWKAGLLKMKRDGGVWTLVVPLHPGRHKYLFLDDGEPKTDPGAETGDGPEGRRVSVRTVK
jgi:1,4-alpha-glucan branching enzyme